MNARRISIVTLYVVLFAIMYFAGNTVSTNAKSYAAVENVPNPCYKWQDVSPFSVIDNRRIRQAHCEPVGAVATAAAISLPTDKPVIITVTGTPSPIVTMGNK